MLRKILTIIFISTIFICFQVSTGHTRIFKYKIINIEHLSRYFEDRIAFQHIEKKPLLHVDEAIDNSIACLLIVKSKKIYLFKDGYDNPYEVKTKKYILETQRKLLPDVWENKVDGAPDFLRITERRIELSKNVTKEFVSKNYKDKYSKWRDAFLKRHVDIFRSLMINRKESGLVVKRIPVPKQLYDKGEAKFRISATAKTIDGKLYYAEDRNGDGLTEIFTVTIPDGFNWGYESGPNIIFIHNINYKSKDGKDTNIEIKNLISKLAHNAYYGTEIEDRIIKKTFIKDYEINDMINDIYQIDPDFKKVMDDHSTK